MNVTVTNLLQVLLAAQSALFGGFLAVRPKAPSNHRLLGAFLLTLSTHMALNFGQELRFTEGWPDVGAALGFLYGPLIYLYTREVAFRVPHAAVPNWVHFIPATAVLLVQCIRLPLPLGILAGIVAASLAAYLICALQITLRFESVLSESRATGQSLGYLRHIVISLLVIGSLDLMHSIAVANEHRWSPYLYAALTAGLLVLVNYLTLKGLHASVAFGAITPEELEQTNNAEDPALDTKASTVGLMKGDLDTIGCIMDREPLERDSELTLDKFARAVGLPRRRVSAAINTLRHQSFSDYINERRIARACQLLEDPTQDHKTILEVLYEVGFSTKSNFYAAFKKLHQQTPVQYRRAAKRSRISAKSPES